LSANAVALRRCPSQSLAAAARRESRADEVALDRCFNPSLDYGALQGAYPGDDEKA
jgi:hypothetical protein